MVAKAVLVVILGLGAYFCDGKSVRSPEFQDPSLHDDIRLSPEQEQEMKERGFYTARKWPKSNGVVRVPYYFDPTFFPEGDAFRDKFRAAAAIYRAQTCIDWVEVSQTYADHKVKIFKDGGCWSYVGMIDGDEQDLSLDDGCHSTGTMLHEMGHCMGLFHTQSRPDRDEYVRPWLENVSPGNANNFDKSTGQTFGIPYDYKSMMHYGRDYFSNNGSFTLTTLDPFAIFAIGSRPDDFRYSDSAFLNKGYECIANFTATCGEKNCMNGGFVGKDCNCRCPENTSGARCETKNGPLFADKPLCGGEVTTERDLTPNGYPANPTSEKCIFAVKAPQCKLPAFTFSEAKFYWTKCNGNSLALEVSKKSFGYVWCDHNNVPLAKTIVSETQNASLYFSTFLQGWEGYGFKARVTFVDDPSCGAPSSTTNSSSTTVTSATTSTTANTTTSSATTTTPIASTTANSTTTSVTTTTPIASTTANSTTTSATTTTPIASTTANSTTSSATTTTATTATTSTSTTTGAPSSSCTITETAFNRFEFKTKNFPSTISEGSNCSLSKTSAQVTDVVFTRLDVDFKGQYPDELEIDETLFRFSYSYGIKTTEYALWPLTINYKAGTSRGKGFKISVTPVSGLPAPCNGQTVNLSTGQIKKISNPLISMKTPDVRCAFKVTAPAGKRLLVTLKSGDLSDWEYLKVAPYLPSYDYLVNVPTSRFTSWGNTVKVYYAGSSTYSAWTLEFKAV